MDSKKVEKKERTRRLSKEGYVAEDGSLHVKFEFVNGEVRDFELNGDLLTKFALHGALAKYGDYVAGMADVDDMVTAVDELHEQLDKGEWTSRTATGASGGSLLVRALAEYKGKTVEEIKAWFTATGKTAADKSKIRQVPAIEAIIKRLQAEKNKGKEVNEEEVLGGLD
jgi:hypothetical protein